jgi:predicted nucleotidyltransferase
VIGHPNKAKELANAFESNKNIITLFLFGSYAKKKTTKLSDIDIGILFKKDYIYSNEELKIIQKLSEIFENNSIDLTVVNAAPPDLAFEVIKTGELLLVNDKEALLEFKKYITFKYFDYRFIKKEIMEHMLIRIQKGTFGHDQT